MRPLFIAFLAACSPTSPAPLIAASSALQEGAEAGDGGQIDMQLHVGGCADVPSTLEYWLTKKTLTSQGMQSTDSAHWFDTNHADLMLAVADGRTEFDAQIDTLLGSWATSLPETTGNEARTLLWNLFASQLDYCPI